MDLKGKNVLVIGTGLSGIGAAALLAKVEANILLFDSNEALDIDALEEKLEAHGVTDAEIEVILGESELTPEFFETLDLAVVSPGIPVDTGFVKAIADGGVPLWSEVELAFTYTKGRVVAITGTNGKTTTTALTGEIMKTNFDSVYVVGNIGTPWTSVALETTPESVIVAEMSSFQLETIQSFKPVVSAILNVTPDHLNRHHTMELYTEVKKNIMKNQTPQDFVVLNYDNKITCEVGKHTVPKAIYFSSTQVLEEGYFFKEGQIIYRHDGEDTLICTSEELNILGIHNMENVMAAVAMATCMNVPLEKIRQALTAFMGVEHRIEYVAEKAEVIYYNDSKGTNTDAAIKAIQAMVRPTLLIGGGYDKQVTFDEWIEAFEGKVRYLVLLGATAGQIEQCAKSHGFNQIIRVESLEEAVETCAKLANPGDAVLLSPACASWGMFKDYEERGRVFKKLVNDLED